jgi:hypothetical protein
MTIGFGRNLAKSRNFISGKFYRLVKKTLFKITTVKDSKNRLQKWPKIRGVSISRHP